MAKKTFNEVVELVRAFLGVGSSASDTAKCQACVQTGYRDVLFPGDLRGRGYYPWTFLQKHTSLTTTASSATSDLPSDFGGILYGFTWADEESRSPLLQVGVQDILEAKAVDTSEDYPTMFAITTSTTAGATTYQAMFWPTPDDAYTLYYGYVICPSMPSGSEVFYGPEWVDELVVAASYAAAERIELDRVGFWHQFLQSRLQAAIDSDRKMQRRDQWQTYWRITRYPAITSVDGNPV